MSKKRRGVGQGEILEVASSDCIPGILQLDKATWLDWQLFGSRKLDRMDQEMNGTLQLDKATWLDWQILGIRKLDRVDHKGVPFGKQYFLHLIHTTTKVELEKNKLQKTSS